MFSTETIIDMARQAAVKAYVEELEPYVPDQGEPDRWGERLPIPNLGSYNPAGWALQEHVLVDATGWGSESEPALTVRGFKEWVKEMQLKYTTPGFAIIEVGQFQVVVGVFIQDDEAEGDTFNVDYCEDCGAAYEIGKEEFCPECEHRLDGTVECEGCYNYVDPADIYDGQCKDCKPYRPGDIVEWDEGTTTSSGTVRAYSDEYTLVICRRPNFDEVIIDIDDVRPGYNPADDPNQIQLPLD